MSATATPTAAPPSRPTSSSRAAAWRATSTSRECPSSASRTSIPSLAVSLPEPFDFGLSTERYRAFGTDLANRWHEDGLHRVLAGMEVRIEASPGGVSVEGAGAELAEPVRRYLGAPFDLDAFAAFATTEPVLAQVVSALRGFRPPLVPEPFETLVTSITAQQISLRAASSIRNRLIEAFGERHEAAYAFPTRERLAAARPEDVVAVGFSGRKADYAVGLARADLDLDALALLPDDEVREALVALPGLGEWTADWFLARHLGRADAWPAGDLALRKAVLHFYGDEADVRAAGARFPGFANLAAHYLLVGHRVHG